MEDYQALFRLWLSVCRFTKSLDESLFVSILSYANESIAAQCCYDWGMGICWFATCQDNLFSVCQLCVQMLLTQYKTTRNYRFLNVIAAILMQLHSMCPWENIDTLTKNTDTQLVKCDSTNSHLSISTSKPLYLIKPQIKTQGRLSSAFFDVYMVVNGQEELVQLWNPLLSSQSFSIRFRENENFILPATPAKSMDNVQEFTNYLFTPLLTILKENQADLNIVWSILHCLPIHPSFYGKNDSATLSIATYSSLLTPELDILPYSLKLLSVLSTSKPIQGDITQLLQPLVLSLTTIASAYESSPLLYHRLLSSLCDSCNSILRPILKSYEGSALYIQYKSYAAWMKDTMASCVGTLKPLSAIITDNDYAIILDLMSI